MSELLALAEAETSAEEDEALLDPDAPVGLNPDAQALLDPNTQGPAHNPAHKPATASHSCAGAGAA